LYYLRNWIVPGSPGRWLDLGCGAGLGLALAEQLGFRERVGVDASQQVVEAWQRLGASVVHADGLRYLEEQGSERWDVISALDLLEHMTPDEGFALVSSVRRALRPGGSFLVKTPNAASPWGFGVTASDVTHRTHFSPSGLRQLALLAGFAEVDVREVGPAPIGIVSAGRFVMWRIVSQALSFLSAIETGSPDPRVNTRVMVARLR
jgi:O-antigen chain-terminating methyltransferase